MPIHFSCKKCGKKLKAPDHAAGKTSKCPQCGYPVTCPEPIYEAEPVETPAAPEIIEDDIDPYADLGREDADPYALAGAPEPVERRRPCPMCGEMILASALKCRHCGEVFDETLKKAETKKKRKKKKRSHDPGDEDLTTGEVLVGIFCAGIGCIMGLIWMIQGKPKGGKLLAISIISNIVGVVLRLVIESMNQTPPGMR